MWEKWMAMAVATATLRPPPTDEAPPMYTPRESKEGTIQQPVTDKMEYQEPPHEGIIPQTSDVLDRPTRQVGYKATPIPAPDTDAYEYIPAKAHTHTAKKHDRMLLMFWLPILLLSLFWAFHNCIRFVIHALKTTFSMKGGLRA